MKEGEKLKEKVKMKNEEVALLGEVTLGEVKNLPQGWAFARLPELITKDGVFIDGDWIESKDQDPNGDVRLIQLADIGDGYFVDKSNRFLTSQKATELNCTLLCKGDILIARMPDPLGRACIFIGDKKAAITVVDVCVIRGKNDHFDNLWLMYFINATAFRDEINALQSGSTRKRISRGNLSTIPLPIPPRAEQTRIVTKLEELLTDLDTATNELKTAQKKLTQYRQSLLKAAVEGRLTEQWRAEQKEEGRRNEESKSKNEENTPNSSFFPPPSSFTLPPSSLLERILKERRTRWEQKQLAKFNEQGKTPPKDWQSKYSEPVKPDTKGLMELPEGWVWANLAQLSEFITSGSRGWAEYYATQGATFIRSQNINKNVLDLADIAFVNPPLSSEGARTLVKTNDILLTITGANVGKVAVVNIELTEAYVSQHVALIRPVESILSNYLHLYMLAGTGGRKQLDKESYGAGKPGLNLQQIASVVVPLPCQKEILALSEKLATHLSALEEQSHAIKIGLKQSAAQRKNILKAAFSGQLIPQNPNDEPASVLLSRIAKERIERGTIGKRKTRGVI